MSGADKAQEREAVREQIMAAYRDAYREAYGRSVQIDYWRGWYSVFSGVTQNKYRERDILNMTTALLARIEGGAA